MDYHSGPVDAAASHDSLLGETLDARYRIVREIGRGGMGVVYEAEHVQLGKRVAVKVMLEKFAQDADAIARFQREALAASRIGNAHIVDVQHIGVSEDGRPFVVMELLSGASLSEILVRTGPMEPWRAIDIMRQTLRAVGAAHAKGIIHRDLKPDNIFLVDDKDQHDFVKLLDFGISKILNIGEDIPTRLTTTGMVMGTPLYMAPEQAMGVEIDPRVDLYACGVILYEMLAGKPPFDGATYPILIAKVLTASPPPLGDVRAGLPANLCAAVHHALQKEPEDRVATADAFVAELHHEHSVSQLALAGTVGVSSSVAHAITRPPTPRRRWPYALAAGVIVAGAAIAIVAANNGGQTAAGAVAPQVLTTAPVATTGTLEIKTIPPGGRVSIDNAESGSTPLAVTVKPGHHHLHIELADYLAVDEDEDVPAGERTSAVITLQLAPPVVAGAGSGSGSASGSVKTKPTGVKTVAKLPPATARGFSDKPVAAQDAPVTPPHSDHPHGATPEPSGSASGYKPNPY